MANDSGSLGATVRGDGVAFGVWAPNAKQVDLLLEDETVVPLAGRPDGIHEAHVARLASGARYRLRIDGGDPMPDPRSRFQPEGVHGPSEVIDPRAFTWTDRGWSGITMDRLILYELHVGAYTAEGTFAALERELAALKELGVTAIELMPVADFPGRWNWGYDGVALWAPSRAYGRPDDLRRLVDSAHRAGLAVILDVVYNHLGPDGNYLPSFAADYFTDRHETPWGAAINCDGPNSRCVRDFIIGNACHWIAEYHLDGLRLDASDHIVDDSDPHLLAEMQQQARLAAPGRDIVIIAEDARNDVGMAHPRETGGIGLDAVWADDFHHEMRVFLTGERENYYANYSGSTEEIARAIEQGFLYQGEFRETDGKERGTQVTDEPATAFVFCIQNHDQIGNRPFGERLHHDIEAGRYAVASTVLLLAPEPPLLFMGQEFAASTPFLFFTDHDVELGKLVTEGRREEFNGFRAFADESLRDSIPDPQAESTFLASKLRLEERSLHAATYRLYRDLIALRKDDSLLAVPDRMRVRAAGLGAQAVVFRRWNDHGHRVVFANFGSATELPITTTPILQDLPEGEWRLLLSTADEGYGGDGDLAHVSGRGPTRSLGIPARSAAVWAIESNGARGEM